MFGKRAVFVLYMLFRSYRSSEKSDANFAKRGLNSKVRSRRFEKNPMIVPLQTAITSVPQFKPTNFPKKQKDMAVLASRSVRSTQVLKRDSRMP